MAVAAGYRIQGINGDINIAVKAIRGSISRPAQLVSGEYIAWHVWTANVEKAEIIPLQNDPSAYGSIRFYWRSRETGESKVRSYAFSQYRIAKAVDFALEFDDNIGTPQTTDWKCFYNAQIKRHSSNSWEYVSQDLFYWKDVDTSRTQQCSF